MLFLSFSKRWFISDGLFPQLEVLVVSKRLPFVDWLIKAPLQNPEADSLAISRN